MQIDVCEKCHSELTELEKQLPHTYLLKGKPFEPDVKVEITLCDIQTGKPIAICWPCRTPYLRACRIVD